MTCEQCKYITVCMAQADCLGQIFDPNYDGEHGCTDFAPCTNADRIRAMSDEEIAKIFTSAVANGCPPKMDWDCAKDEYGWDACDACWCKWLQQPAEGK